MRHFVRRSCCFDSQYLSQNTYYKDQKSVSHRGKANFICVSEYKGLSTVDMIGYLTISLLLDTKELYYRPFLQRPRKIGAKFTGDKIAPDEHIQPTFSFDYDGKRDRWNGYDPQEHERVIQEFAKVEEVRMSSCG